MPRPPFIAIGIVFGLVFVRLALPKFRNNVTTRTAGIHMKSQLRRVTEVWDSLNRTGKALDSANLAAAGFTATAPGVYTDSGEYDYGVRIRILEAGANGYAAEARHEQLAEDARCGIWAGSAKAPVRGASEAEPTCVRFYEPLLGRERLRR